MKQIVPYLTFNGNCREAMYFYQECLGGELMFQTIGESPMADKLPPEMAACILHATLTQEGLTLMASDMVGDKGLIRGNNVSMTIHCSSEEEIRTVYAKLSTGGEMNHPLENTFWGALFGDLTDKFGNQWVLHFEKNVPDL